MPIYPLTNPQKAADPALFRPLDGASDKTRILIVDDEDHVRKMLRDWLCQGGYEVTPVAGARDALALLEKHSFDLILSDIMMPGMTGLELAREVRARGIEAGILMLTGCDDVPTAVAAMQYGALDYLTKPVDLDGLDVRMQEALRKQRQALEESRELASLRCELGRSAREMDSIRTRLRGASDAMLEALVAALDARTHETQCHSKRVSRYSQRLGKVIGLDEDSLRMLSQGALLHDIGKIGVPDAILLKPGKLSQAEWSLMRKHPEIGCAILQNIDQFAPVAELVLAHHERFDGGGYPRQLRAHEIPFGARVFAVADSLDAMTSGRPYCESVSYPVACREIERCSGTQFDPLVVRYFRQIPVEEWIAIRETTSD